MKIFAILVCLIAATHGGSRIATEKCEQERIDVVLKHLRKTAEVTLSDSDNLPSDSSQDEFGNVLKKIVQNVIRDCAEILETLDEFLGESDKELSPKDEILKENFMMNGLKHLSDETGQ